MCARVRQRFHSFSLTLQLLSIFVGFAQLQQAAVRIESGNEWKKKCIRQENALEKPDFENYQNNTEQLHTNLYRNRKDFPKKRWSFHSLRITKDAGCCHTHKNAHGKRERERASERYHHWHWISGRWQQQHSNTNINVWAVSEGEDCIAHVDEQIHSIRRMRTHCTLRYIRATGWLHPVTAFTRLWYAYTYFSLSSTRWRILFISQYASQDSCLWVELGKCLPRLAYCW